VRYQTIYVGEEQVQRDQGLLYSWNRKEAAVAEVNKVFGKS
jgi:hypothetical protein